MTFNNLNKIKKVLGEENVRKFYYLIPLDITTSLLELLSISIIIPFVAAISDKEKVLSSEYGNFIINNFSNYNEFLLALVVVLILVSFSSMALSIYSTSRKITLVNQIGQNVSQIKYKEYLLAEYKFHSSVNNTEVSKNLMTEVTRFTNNVLIASVMMVSKAFFLIVIFAFMISVNPLISLSIVSSLALIYLIIYKGLQNKLLSNGKAISGAIANLFSIVSESLNGIKETKFYGLENYYSERYIDNSDTIANKTASSQIISLVPKNVIEFIVFTSLVTILIYLNNNGILIENLPVITFFLYSGYRSLPAFQQVYNSSALIRANYESVNQILKFDHLIENDDDLEPELKSDEISSIAVKGIDFRFGDQKVLFKDFSSIITGPALVAIVGKSGSGKSTLIDLLLKLNHPASGEILINGDKYTYGDARSLFAYVPQSIYLSDSTLLDNIYLGNIRLPIDYELVVKSVKLAGLESFVEGLPKGIHTKIGENGSLLSGGQRKRLGLARAFYSEKPVLILDEVTSGLDEVTEKDILNDLKLMSKSKLIILITHSSQNIALFDRVIDLNLYQNV